VHAAATPSQALTYTANGHVEVIEAGNLTTVGTGQSPLWSPNGQHLLFSALDFIRMTADFYVADTHGANVNHLVSKAYPYVNPSWSTDSGRVVYTAVASGSKATANPVKLNIETYTLATSKTQSVAQTTLTGGCVQSFTALQSAMTLAEGAYRGVPSTLILAPNNAVVVQSSCTGVGLTVLRPHAKPLQLPTWEGGVLSPDGKSVAAVISGPAKQAGQIGMINLATGKTQVLAPHLGASSVIWSHDGSAVFVASQPTNSATGFARMYAVTKDGKQSVSVGAVKAAGLLHLSIDPTGKNLALALVGSASPKVVVPPPVTVYNILTQKVGQGQPLIVGSQPSWRP
jgi:Tol biopolymer transport system component